MLRWEWDAALDDTDHMVWRDLQSKTEDAFGEWIISVQGMDSIEGFSIDS